MPYGVSTAFLTTTPFILGEKNDWHEGKRQRAFIAQPTQPLKSLSPTVVEAEIEQLWQDFLVVRESVERIVVYLDMPGTPELLDRLSTAGFASRDMIFVLCSCQYLEKINMLHERGFSKSVKHRSSCGVTLLEEMFLSHIDSGHLLAS